MTELETSAVFALVFSGVVVGFALGIVLCLYLTTRPDDEIPADEDEHNPLFPT